MKKIKLTKGKFALVDDEDYEYLNQWKWCVGGSYAVRWRRKSEQIDGTSQVVRMHRLVMGNPDNNLEVDHIDGNRLNNQKINLRVCTHLQNSRNRKSTNSTGYKGINHKGKYGYEALIWNGEVNLYLGTFPTKERAAKAYDKKAIELFGEFANTNF